VPRASIALPLALALSWPAGTGAGERSLDLGLELLSGVDTNPGRVPGPGSDPDGLLQLLARLRGGLSGERWQAWASLHEGLRLFAETASARALASRLEAAGALELGAGLSGSLAASASDLREQGGPLDQEAVRGEAALSWRGRAAGASLSGGWSLFAPRAPALRPFTSRGPEAGLRGWAQPAPGHRLDVGGRVSVQDYPRWRGATGELRRDEAMGLTAEWAWRGPLVAALGYGFTRNDSNEPGGSLRRHRATLRAAVPLAGEAVLVGRAALQWTRQREPLRLLQEQIQIEAGQEALDAVDLRVALPLAGGLELALGAVGHWSDRSAGQPSYERLLLTIGVSWRARWERGGDGNPP